MRNILRRNKATRNPSARSVYVEEMDRELKRFLFSFLPALFVEISDHMENGFSVSQVAEIHRYFQQAIALSAIAHPHRQFVLFGNMPHKRVRKLRDHFNGWCRSCANGDGLPVKEKLRNKMEDALANLSRTYRIASEISLTEEEKKLVLTVTSSINDTITALPTLGLKSIDRFVEMSLGMPGIISTSRQQRRTAANRRSSDHI